MMLMMMIIIIIYIIIIIFLPSIPQEFINQFSGVHWMFMTHVCNVMS